MIGLRAVKNRISFLCGSFAAAAVAVYHNSANNSRRDEPFTFSDAIAESRRQIRLAMMHYGIPGAVVAVAVNGEIVWNEGIGLADVENNVPCTENTVMRVASVSKCLTAVAVAKAWQDGKLNLDVPIQTYVPSYPKKCVDGVPVVITLRHLLGHTSGVRHFRFNNKDEYFCKDYLIAQHCDSVAESLKLFADDDLVMLPGSRFHYTTYGWTLISAALENALGKPFLKIMKEQVFHPLNMTSTGEELHSSILPHRGRQYLRDSEGRLQNAPYVDNSCKLAGAGFVSTAADLIKFGSAILAASTHDDASTTPLLLPGTVAQMWKVAAKMTDEYHFGWGWVLVPDKARIAGVPPPIKFIGHIGKAIGSSSVLLLAMPDSKETSVKSQIAVAIIFNLQGVPKVFHLAQAIAEHFMTL